MEGKRRESVRLFKEMMRETVEPNGFTLTAMVKACGELGDLKLGSCVHGVALKGRFDSEGVIVNGIIDMCGKNYNWRGACNLFDEMSTQDTI